LLLISQFTAQSRGGKGDAGCGDIAPLYTRHGTAHIAFRQVQPEEQGEAGALSAPKQRLLCSATLTLVRNTSLWPPESACPRGVVTFPVAPGYYPGRAGGLWLRSTLVLSGLQAVVVPSGFSTTVQPIWWIATWWWKKQYNAQSLTLVLPPFAW